MLPSSGNSCFSHPAICSGDQSRLSLRATITCNLGCTASRHGFGRRASFHACASASVARYRWRPPWRAMSRLTVEGDRPIPAAIWRIEVSAAMPREISSRSASVSARRERRRVAGTMPPFDDTTPCTDPACLPSARPMSLKDCPAFHRCHSSAFWDAESPGRPI